MMAGHCFPEEMLSQYVNIAISSKFSRGKEKKRKETWAYM